MEDELEKIRMEKLKKLQQQQEELKKQAEEEEIRRAQVKAIINKILSPEARQRLTNIKLADEERAEKIQQMLIYLYQLGRIQSQLTDDEFKKLLLTLSKKRETKIIRK